MGSTRLLTFSLPATHGTSDDDSSTDQHENLDDVLPFKAGREGKLGKANLREQDERYHSSGHL